jgi:hypothetical protein
MGLSWAEGVKPPGKGAGRRTGVCRTLIRPRGVSKQREARGCPPGRSRRGEMGSDGERS